jgi:CDP-glycerol glycerophosphotransferase (TagB/SpsB family)
VGFPKSDELVNGKSTRDEVIKEFGLDEKEPIIVYAPSWDDKDALRKGSIDALSKVMALPYKNILLCLHEYDKMFKTLEGKKVIKAPNKNRYLLAADLVIGDISSIMIEFTLLNKPMVHIDMTGDRHHYGIWEEPTCHYGTFQVGDFATPDQLQEKVKDALNNPDKFKRLREYWKWRSFYNLGNAAKISANEIIRATEYYIPPKKRFIFF